MLKLEEVKASAHMFHGLNLLFEVKRELKRIHINGCRCNERLNAKTEGSKRLAYTGLRG